MAREPQEPKKSQWEQPKPNWTSITITNAEGKEETVTIISEKKLGEGQFGVVKKGNLAGKSEPFIIKIFKSNKVDDDGLTPLQKELNGLRQAEKALGTQLLYGYNEKIIVMPYLGKDFSNLKDHEIFPRFMQSADLLITLHKADLIHRDFKEPNVVQRSTGRVALIDFGTLGYVKSTGFLDANGSAFYWPPETWSTKKFTKASEVFSYVTALARALGIIKDISKSVYKSQLVLKDDAAKILQAKYQISEQAAQNIIDVLEPMIGRYDAKINGIVRSEKAQNMTMAELKPQLEKVLQDAKLLPIMPSKDALCKQVDELEQFTTEIVKQIEYTLQHGLTSSKERRSLLNSWLGNATSVVSQKTEAPEAQLPPPVSCKTFQDLLYKIKGFSKTIHQKTEQEIFNFREEILGNLKQINKKISREIYRDKFDIAKKLSATIELLTEPHFQHREFDETGIAHLNPTDYKKAECAIKNIPYTISFWHKKKYAFTTGETKRISPQAKQILSAINSGAIIPQTPSEAPERKSLDQEHSRSSDELSRVLIRHSSTRHLKTPLPSDALSDQPSQPFTTLPKDFDPLLHKAFGAYCALIQKGKPAANDLTLTTNKLQLSMS